MLDQRTQARTLEWLEAHSISLEEDLRMAEVNHGYFYKNRKNLV